MKTPLGLRQIGRSCLHTGMGTNARASAAPQVLVPFLRVLQKVGKAEVINCLSKSALINEMVRLFLLGISNALAI